MIDTLDKNLAESLMIEVEAQSALRRLVAEGRLAKEDWPRGAAVTPEDLCLQSVDDEYRLPDGAQPFQTVLIEEALASEFSDFKLCHDHIIDSTNTAMLAKAAQEPIDALMYLAEFQASGRGRRGRAWVSPFAKNIAMSLGHSSARPLHKMGGLSLVVGLGAAAALERHGLAQVSLKWPNDLWVNHHKLGGILVELVKDGEKTAVVVGLGINVLLTQEEREVIDQAVTDLREHRVSASRSELVIDLYRSIKRNLRLFDERGFEPFIAAFDAIHCLHQQECLFEDGEQLVQAARVEGVGQEGELIVNVNGQRRNLFGGEISIRPRR